MQPAGLAAAMRRGAAPRTLDRVDRVGLPYALANHYARNTKVQVVSAYGAFHGGML